MIPQRKRPPAANSPELDFDTTQEIDPALVDSILSRSDPTMVQGDFDDTEILLDIGKPAKPAARRR
jgi:hypothetical protein